MDVVDLSGVVHGFPVNGSAEASSLSLDISRLHRGDTYNFTVMRDALGARATPPVNITISEWGTVLPDFQRGIIVQRPKIFVF